MSKEALEALERIQGLVDESKGVYGFHLNGDLETWDYFEIEQDLHEIRKALERARKAERELKINNHQFDTTTYKVIDMTTGKIIAKES